MSSAPSWTVCFQSKDGRKIASLEHPTQQSLQDLYQIAESTFDSPIASLKVGFPPRLLEQDADTCIATVLQNQERITVELQVVSSTNKKNNTSGGKKKKTTTTKAKTTASTSSTASRSRPQRQAAKAAQEAMPEVIKAQDKFLREQQKQQQSKKRKNSANNSSSSSSGNSNAKKKPPASPKFSNQVGTGRRLADGAAVAAPKSSSKRGGGGAAASRLLQQQQGGQQQQQQDMGESLLNALNHPGTMGQVLRKGMKNAVQASYETSRAFSRLAAIQAKTYQKEIIMGAAAAGGGNIAAKLKVTYKGSVDKVSNTDTVDCVPEDVLEQVLKGIYESNQEALRPENLALLSPRVLWSLVHLYPRFVTVQECYQELLPDLDWSFLRRRAEKLSEKAAENLRQEQAKNGDNDEDGNTEHALEAVAAVEHAMEHLHDFDASQRRRLASEAALARLQQPGTAENNTEEEWRLETPSEEDRDELVQIMQSINAPPEGDLDELVQTFYDNNVHNWRELALVDDEAAATLAEKLNVPKETLESWVDAAQSESVPEIIVEICDNNADNVDLLIEYARSSTPKDLEMWRSMPQMLHSTIGSPSTISIDQIRSWCERAHSLLQEFEWLNWYATPVE